MIDLLCPSKKLRLKANSNLWRKKSGLETGKDHFRLAKMAFQKPLSKKEKSYFQEKIEKNANNSKELWKSLKSL